MNIEISNIKDRLVQLLMAQQPVLKIVTQESDKFEVTGTLETMQGKKKVDGIYFSSVVPKAKDVRLYFFPIYTHVEQFKDLPPTLQKCLKGKSCFHIKKMDLALEEAIKEMIAKGIAIYQKEGWLASS